MEALNIFKKLFKKLPEPVKRPFLRLYNRIYTQVDEEMIENLEIYYKLERKEIMRLMRSASQLSADFWRCSKPASGEEVKSFYKTNPFYVLDLIFWHGTKYQRLLREKFVNLAKGKVLDYGGGAGDLCLKITKKRLCVHYADLGGKTFDFAKWLFAKNNSIIKMINLSESKISEKYDTIFCIDVIEHAVDPKNILRDIAGHLCSGGYLVITALDPVVGELRPMHFGFDFNPKEYLKSLGLEKGKEEFLWIKNA